MSKRSRHNAASSGFAGQMIGATLPEYLPGHARRVAHVLGVTPETRPAPAPPAAARLQKTSRSS